MRRSGRLALRLTHPVWRQWPVAWLLTLLIGCAHPGPPPGHPGGPVFGGEPGPGAQMPAESALQGQKGASLQLTSEGLDYMRMGRLDEALSKFQKAISLSSTNPYAYYYFAEVRYLRREFHQSIPLLDRAAILLSGEPAWTSRVHLLRGKNYESLFRFEEARAEYKLALHADPKNAEARDAVRRLRDPAPSP